MVANAGHGDSRIQSRSCAPFPSWDGHDSAEGCTECHRESEQEQLPFRCFSILVMTTQRADSQQSPSWTSGSGTSMESVVEHSQSSEQFQLRNRRAARMQRLLSLDFACEQTVSDGRRFQGSGVWNSSWVAAPLTILLPTWPDLRDHLLA